MLFRVFPRLRYQRRESEGFPVLTTLSYTVSVDPRVVSVCGYSMV
jgi:hypothetical protein